MAIKTDMAFIDQMINTLDQAFYCSYLLFLLHDCGDMVTHSGFPRTIVRECHWFLLENQLEKLCDLLEAINQLEPDPTNILKDLKA